MAVIATKDGKDNDKKVKDGHHGKVFDKDNNSNQQ